MKFQSAKYSVFLLLVFLINTAITAQTLSSDEYFQEARKTAFDQKDYPAAIKLCNLALQKSPDYTDIEVFLGRLYYWNDKADSARYILAAAQQKNPDHEEAAIALTDVEYFSDNYSTALAYCENFLRHHTSKELMLRKAKCLSALKRYKEAYTLTDSILQTDPHNDQFRSLAMQIKDYSASNKIGVSYDYMYFDKQFSDPWHFVSLDYTRQTKAGSFTGRINYANRFTKNGVQFEADAYPRISKLFYAYANIGYSPDLPIFSKYRAGFSLFASLPKSFEADAGFRYLNFDNDTWIYTIGAGKYYKNFWFNARTYLTPGNSRISQSYTITTRYYLKGADDYLSFYFGKGISPDEQYQSLQLNSIYKLQTTKLGAGYRFSVHKMNIFSLSGTYENVEYLPKTKGNQVDLSIGYQRRF